MIFPNLISNCFNLLYLRNKLKNLLFHKLIWPFSFQKNCSSDLKKITNSLPSASNFKIFSWSLEQFFLTVALEKNTKIWLYNYFDPIIIGHNRFSRWAVSRLASGRAPVENHNKNHLELIHKTFHFSVPNKPS